MQAALRYEMVFGRIQLLKIHVRTMPTDIPTIDEMKLIEAKASPGEWREPGVLLSSAKNERMRIAGLSMRIEDWEFIAAGRSYIPWTFGELQRLRAENTELRAALLRRGRHDEDCSCQTDPTRCSCGWREQKTDLRLDELKAKPEADA